MREEQLRGQVEHLSQVRGREGGERWGEVGRRVGRGGEDESSL